MYLTLLSLPKSPNQTPDICLSLNNIAENKGVQRTDVFRSFISVDSWYDVSIDWKRQIVHLSTFSFSTFFLVRLQTVSFKSFHVPSLSLPHYLLLSFYFSLSVPIFPLSPQFSIFSWFRLLWSKREFFAETSFFRSSVVRIFLAQFLDMSSWRDVEPSNVDLWSNKYWLPW